MGKNIFTIVGIAKSWPENSFVYANIDYAVLVPMMTSLALSKYVSINDIIFLIYFVRMDLNVIYKVKLIIGNYYLLAKILADILRIIHSK